MTGLDEPLDLLGQAPTFNIYTQITSIFALDDAGLQESIVNTLRTGLERLAASFPWTAGQVIQEGATEGDSGVMKMKSFEQIPRLVVKDLRDSPSMPSIEVFREANFPFTMLDENIIAPRHTFPGGPGETPSDPAPVFLVQATFITGGLLLTFVAAHNTMDMTGQAQIVHLLSKACKGEPFTSEELSSGNLARRHLVPYLDDSIDLESEIAHQLLKNAPVQPASDKKDSTPISPPSCVWAYFYFDPASLAELKSLAADSRTTDYITTDDALSVLVWQSVTRARAPRLNPDSRTTLARAIDVRRYLNVPSTYAGILQNMTYHKARISEVIKEPLGRRASELRVAVDPKTSTISHKTRALLTHINRSKTKDDTSITASLDLTVDLMISSWSKPDFYSFDFGLGLGAPVAVRRPHFVPVESLVYFMPKSKDGEIAVAIGLREEDMEKLKADPEFIRYGKYVG